MLSHTIQPYIDVAVNTCAKFIVITFNRTWIVRMNLEITILVVAGIVASFYLIPHIIMYIVYLFALVMGI